MSQRLAVIQQYSPGGSTSVSGVSTSRPSWPQGQNFGLGLVTSGSALVLASGRFGFAIKLLSLA